MLYSPERPNVFGFSEKGASRKNLRGGEFPRVSVEGSVLLYKTGRGRLRPKYQRLPQEIQGIGYPLFPQREREVLCSKIPPFATANTAETVFLFSKTSSSVKMEGNQ